MAAYIGRSNGSTMIVVTGASGMLGSQVVAHLAKAQPNTKIQAWYRSESSKACALQSWKAQGASPENVKWIQINLLDANAVEKALVGATHVVHCAALVSFRAKDKDKMLKDNPAMSENVAAGALKHGVKNLVHISSIATLSSNNEVVCEEDSDQEEGLNTYGRSKLYSEQTILKHGAKGLPCWILNPSVILGAPLWPDGSSKIIHTLKKGLPFYSPGATGWVDVRDVADAATHLINTPGTGERIILNGTNATFQQAFAALAHALGVKAPSSAIAPWVLQIAWRVERLRERLFGHSPSLTKDSVKAACGTKKYSNKKALEHGLQFKSLEDTGAFIASLIRDRN